MLNAISRLRNGGLGVRIAALALMMFVAWLVCAPIAWWISGQGGMAAAAVAAGLCLLGTANALVFASFFPRPIDAWKGMLLGIFPRMGIPLTGAVALQISSAPLAEAGLLVYLIIFYQVALGVETLLCVPSGRNPEKLGDTSAEVPPGTTRLHAKS